MDQGYLFATELVRLAFVLGIGVSTLLHEKFRFKTGSVVVPGYLGVLILQPELIVSTLASAVIAYIVVVGAVARLTGMTSRATYFALIAFSVGLHLAWWWAVAGPTTHADHTAYLLGIGFVVPGLIAHDMRSFGPVKTLVRVMISTLLVAGAVLAVAVAFPHLAQPKPLPSAAVLAFDLRWLPLAMGISAFAAVALQQQHGLKAGGLVGAAYIALFSAHPAQLAFFLAVATATCLVTSHCLLPRMVLFGQRRFAAVLLVGMAVAWSALAVAEASGNRSLGFFGTSRDSPLFAVITIVLAGLLAHDVLQIGLARTARGAALSVLFVLATTLSIAELAGAGRSKVLLPGASLAISLGAFIFWPYLKTAGRWVRWTNVAGRPIPPPPMTKSAVRPPQRTQDRLIGLLRWSAAGAVVLLAMGILQGMTNRLPVMETQSLLRYARQAALQDHAAASAPGQARHRPAGLPTLYPGTVSVHPLQTP